MGSYKYCLCFTRKFRWNEAEPPADVRAAFDAFAEGGATMSPEQLRRFLAESQGEAAATAGDAEKAIDQLRQLRHRLAKLNRPGMSLDDFHHFLFSEELNPPILPQLHQDMTAPLSHYYIYTGHNSYLTGNQLSSDCSDVPIVKALLRGVRVIELDMWPNATKDNIDILHGRTLTTPVELIKCLKSIKEHAFTASPYPVVITLEDHLTPDLQAKVAKMVIQTFGDLLYYPESDTLEKFPSPEALKKRIILSTKPPKEYLEAKDKESGSSNENVPKEEEAWGNEVPDLKIETEADEKSENDQNEDEEDDDDKIRQNLAPEYKRLITIRAGKPKGELVDILELDPGTVRRISLSEQELAKAVASLGPNLVRFTQKNLLRIYPKGTRLNSSNYNPFVGWIHGAQMVAFNMQGYGRALWLMHGFFQANGGCGYVKKPDFLLNGFHGGTFNPKASLPVKRTLKVKVYMGDGWRLDFKQTYFDAYSPPDFYTRMISDPDSLDLIRTLRMGCYGVLVSGPSLHLWFNFLSRILPRQDVPNTFKKMFLGQATYGPVMTAVFFSVNAGLQGETGYEIIARLRRDLLPTLINGLVYWPMCDFITFKFVPVRLQPLVSNSFSFLWTIYITYMAGLEKASVERIEDE